MTRLSRVPAGGAPIQPRLGRQSVASPVSGAMHSTPEACDDQLGHRVLQSSSRCRGICPGPTQLARRSERRSSRRRRVCSPTPLPQVGPAGIPNDGTGRDHQGSRRNGWFLDTLLHGAEANLGDLAARLVDGCQGDQDYAPEISRRLHALPMMPTTDWAIESDQWKDIVQAYLACVAFEDAQVRKVLDALDASPHANSTYVVLWGDQGYHIGEKNRFGKHSVWEEATRTPLIIAGPGISPGMTRKPARLIDQYPTLSDLCGLPVNPANEGHSLRPVLDDPASADWPPHAALTTYGRNNHGVPDERYRYIRYEDGSEELYDHEDDAHEWNNVADDPARKATIERLAAHLPEVNAPWSEKSVYDYNPHLTEHRKRNL